MASETEQPAGPSECRYCSTKCTRDITSVYLFRGREEIYSEMLSETFNIIVYSESTFENILSHMICIKCVSKLRDAFKFKKRVVECETVLEQYIQKLAYKSPKTSEHGRKEFEDVPEELIDLKEEEEKVSTYDNDVTDCEEFEDVPEELIDLKEEEEKVSTYDNDVTDCEEESYKHHEEISMSCDESVSEESPHKDRKRKATPDIELLGPQTRSKKAKIKDLSKVESQPESVESRSVSDIVAYKLPPDITIKKTKEEPVIKESANKIKTPEMAPNTNFKKSITILAKRIKVKSFFDAVDNPTSKSFANKKACDPSEDVIIPKEEPDSEELAHKARKPKTSKTIKSKQLQTQCKRKDFKKTVGKCASKNTEEGDELNEAAPNAAMINAKLIVKFATAYPFKVGRNDDIGCAYCKENFPTKHPDQFRTHVNTMHAYLDKTMAISFSPYDRLTRVDVSDLACRICSKTFQTLEATAEHLKEVHAFKINLNESLGLVPIKLVPQTFDCSVCGSNFNTLRRLSIHSGSHFALNVCPVCGKKTESRSGHCSHSSSGKFSCAICKQSFESLEDRRLHYKKSKSCMPYKCLDCGEGFTSSEFRQRHYVESHEKAERILACTKCNETFAYRSKLTQHFNSTHTDLYQCHYCQKRLWSNVSLNTHVARIHTLEKAYKCQYCESSYFEKHLLKIHMRIHDDNKKFHCGICGRMFVRRYRLRDHLVKSHPGVNVEEYINK